MKVLLYRILLASALTGALVACSAGPNKTDTTATQARPHSIAASTDLAGVTITVGSKEFTEQRILGEILIKTLSAAGASVKDETGLAGSTARTALEKGRIDIYYEYTGTAWISGLKRTTPVPGEQAQFDAVKSADAKNGITWLAVAPGNNTYAIAANDTVMKKYSPEAISDFAQLANENPGAAGLCTEAEFVNRDDGLPGLEDHYGFALPDAQISQLDYGLVYASVTKGNPCDFAVVFATDGQIKANHLTVLKDDKEFFPLYNVAISMNSDVYSAHPRSYDELFGALNKLLTNEQLIEMNAAVDVEGRNVDEVVDEFLRAANVT